MILQEIAARTLIRVNDAERARPLHEVRAQAEALPLTGNFPFEKALRKKDIAFICEVKKASPSKGVIAADFPYLTIAREYEAAGADAVSVLTEPYYFQGRDEYLRDIAGILRIPALRKDFTVDPYQIYEAKLLGASAVLLIAALLETRKLMEFVAVAHSLGLSALTEAHDERETESALRAGARIVGVNNRNLRDFTVDIGNSLRLRPLIPRDVLMVAESGIREPEDIQALREAGVNAVLIGETLMRAPDKKAAFQALRG